MKTNALVLLGAILTIHVSTVTGRTALITRWDFNAISLTPSTGVGSIQSAGFTSFSFSAGRESASNQSSDSITPSTSNRALTVDSFPSITANNLSAGIRVNVSTVGYDNIVVSWDQRHTDSSSRYVRFQYSLDGTTWVNDDVFNGSQASVTWFNGRTVNLSNIPGVKDNSAFAFRIVSEFQSTATGSGSAAYAPSGPAGYSGGGTWRFDMITISGETLEPVPEPTSIALSIFAAGALTLTSLRVWRTRRNRTR
jgi:hypothetical protein